MRAPADFLVVGAGIAGASIAYFLAPHGRVILLEREPQPGYHSTGRSAALFMESYGTPQVRALTMASRAFLQQPPAGFSEHPLLTPRRAMFVGTHGQEALLEEHWNVLRSVTPDARRLSADEAHAMVPVLRRGRGTRDSAGLDAVERQRNLAGRFRVARPWDGGLPGGTLVLVDDVVTSGATLTEAARALSGPPADRATARRPGPVGGPPVVAAVVAATPRRSPIPIRPDRPAPFTVRS